MHGLNMPNLVASLPFFYFFDTFNFCLMNVCWMLFFNHRDWRKDLLYCFICQRFCNVRRVLLCGCHGLRWQSGVVCVCVCWILCHYMDTAEFLWCTLFSIRGIRMTSGHSTVLRGKFQIVSGQRQRRDFLCNQNWYKWKLLLVTQKWYKILFRS